MSVTLANSVGYEVFAVSASGEVFVAAFVDSSLAEEYAVWRNASDPANDYRVWADYCPHPESDHYSEYVAHITG